MVLLVGDDFMGLAIDGNVVHGIARGGQAFVSYSNTLFDFSKAALDTKIYFSSTTLIGEADVKNDHFVVRFQPAGDMASIYDNFCDCRIIGAVYLSEDNILTDLEATAGLYYLFSVYALSIGAGTHYSEGKFFIRADQVVPKPSGSSDSSMITTQK